MGFSPPRQARAAHCPYDPVLLYGTARLRPQKTVWSKASEPGCGGESIRSPYSRSAVPCLQKNLVTPSTSYEVEEDNDRHCITFAASVSTLALASLPDPLQVGELSHVRSPLAAEEVHLDDRLPVGALP